MPLRDGRPGVGREADHQGPHALRREDPPRGGEGFARGEARGHLSPLSGEAQGFGGSTANPNLPGTAYPGGRRDIGGEEGSQNPYGRRQEIETYRRDGGSLGSPVRRRHGYDQAAHDDRTAMSAPRAGPGGQRDYEPGPPPLIGGEDRRRESAPDGYGDSIALTSQFLSPDDRPGRASAKKRGAPMYEPRAAGEDYHGQESTVRDLYGKEGDNQEDFKSSGSATGNNIPRNTHLFKSSDGEASRKAPERKVKVEGVTTQNPQGSGKDEEVSLFHYKGPHETICLGRIAKGLKVCIRHAGICPFQHRQKAPLVPGFYIQVPNKRGAPESVYAAPHVTAEQAQASPPFTQLLDGPLPMSQMLKLLQVTIDGAWTAEPNVVQAFVRAAELKTSAKTAATPCKRVKLTPAEDEHEVDESVWPEAEKIINGALTRLNSVEGTLGVPPADRTATTLWGGQEHTEVRLSTVESFLDSIPEALTGVQDAVGQATRIAKHANNTVQGYVGAGGANAALQPLSTRLEALDRLVQTQAHELHRLGQANATLSAELSQTSKLCLGWLQGTIRLPTQGAPPAHSGVPRSTFDTFVATTTRNMAVLQQDIKGGGYSIVGREFNVLGDSVLFCQNFLPPNKNVFECMVAIMALIQMIKKDCLSSVEQQAEESHAFKTQKTGRQSAVMVSFGTTFPEIFGDSKSGEYHFSKLKTPDAWCKVGVLEEGLRYTLQAGIREQREALGAHIDAVLEGYPEARELAHKMLDTTCDWWEWFAEAVSTHAKQVLTKACAGVSCTNKVRAQCWHRAMGSVRGFFIELRAVRVHASGAEYQEDFAKKHGRYLHSSLQELRIMQEFRAADFVRHRSVQNGMMEHIFETYQPRDGADVTSRVKILETKAEEATKTLGQHRADINRLKK